MSQLTSFRVGETVVFVPTGQRGTVMAQGPRLIWATGQPVFHIPVRFPEDVCAIWVLRDKLVLTTSSLLIRKFRVDEEYRM